MDHTVERELTVPEEAEEVWRSLAEPEWLGEDAAIELREAGEVRAGDRDGFVEEADAPRRLVFWWSAPDEEPPAWRSTSTRPKTAPECE